MWLSEKSLPERSSSKCKGPVVELARHVLEAVRRPVWLELRSEGRAVSDSDKQAKREQECRPQTACRALHSCKDFGFCYGRYEKPLGRPEQRDQRIRVRLIRITLVAPWRLEYIVGLPHVRELI